MKKNIKYIIQLSKRERQCLKNIIRKGEHKSRVITRSRILLKSHAGETDATIARHLSIGERTAQRVRIRYHEGKLNRALHDAPRPGAPATVTMEAEAHLAAIACTRPPEGSAHWTLELLRERMLKDMVVDHISTVAIWHHLNDRGIKPWREKNVGDPDSHSRVH